MLAPAVLPLGRFAGMTARAVNDRPYGVVICLLPYSLKIWYFRQVCRGRIDASRAVLPLYRNIRAVATGGIYAAPTNNRKSSNYRQNVRFPQVCRGRINASRAVLPLYRNIRAAATGGIYAAPTNNRKSSNYRQNVIFPQICRGRIDASRAVLPIYRNIRAAATGGIVAVPTNDPQNCHHRKTRGGHFFFLVSYLFFRCPCFPARFVLS